MTNDEGEIIGMYAGFCEIEWPTTCSGSQYISGIPYGNQTEEDSLVYEDGYKGLRGYLTEGRYLVFESNGFALTRDESLIDIVYSSGAASNYNSISQRWVLHAQTQEGTTFKISSAVDGSYIALDYFLTSDESNGEVYEIVYAGNGQYTIKGSLGFYMSITDGLLVPTLEPGYFNIWSVTYSS